MRSERKLCTIDVEKFDLSKINLNPLGDKKSSKSFKDRRESETLYFSHQLAKTRSEIVNLKKTLETKDQEIEALVRQLESYNIIKV